MRIPNLYKQQLLKIRDLYAQHPRIVIGVISAYVLIVFAVIGWAVWFTYNIACTLPDQQTLKRAGNMAQATTIFDDADKPVFTIYREQRIEVPLSKMSPHLIDAIISVEDQRFYEHHGIDPIRVFGAAVANLRHARRAQGGSTITQQLARRSFLTPDKTIRRKIAELMLAVRLEKMFTKQQILEMYLNRVYFGDGFYGVEAASLGFFGKHAADLDTAESALLAGLVQSPSSYAPTINKSRSVARRNVVLQAMRDAGKIDRGQWEDARHEPVVLHDALEANDNGFGQYFKEQVRRELVAKFGWQRVYEGGLRVYTTLDPAMQQAAESAVDESLKELDAKIAARKRVRESESPKVRKSVVADAPPLQAALVAIEPTTGAVRAMVGGRDFDNSTFNRAVQARRQPGSAFKPFVYAQAIEAGFTPASLIDHLDDPVLTEQGAWVPEDEHLDVDEVTLRTGLRTSSNRAAVRLLQEVGIPKTIDYAKSVGLNNLPAVPSLALGSGDVTLLTLAMAYVPFADNGMEHASYVIRRIEDRDGIVLFTVNDQPRQVLSPTSAFLMDQMLADVIDAGTANKARAMGFSLPAAGKTGTTNGYNDAWFIGFTPKVLAGVWVGYDQPQTIMRSGYAGDVAVPMWARFMKLATAHDQPVWYPVPENVTSVRVCRMSGKIAVDGCEHVPVEAKDGTVSVRSMAYYEYFVRGTEPTDTCPLHGGSIFNRIVNLFGGGQQKAAPESSVGAPNGSTTTPVASAGAAEGKKASGAAVADGNGNGKQSQASGEEPKKKRSFWSRLFGRGKKDEKK